jgi:transposase
MDYQQAADEARHLVRRSEQDWWRLAELTWHQVDAGTDRAQWAADLGVAYQTVNRWVQLWKRFGSVPAAERPRWAEAWRRVARGEP